MNRKHAIVLIAMFVLLVLPQLNVLAEFPTPAPSDDWAEDYHKGNGLTDCYKVLPPPIGDPYGVAIVNWGHPDPCGQKPAHCELSWKYEDEQDIGSYFECDSAEVAPAADWRPIQVITMQQDGHTLNDIQHFVNGEWKTITVCWNQGNAQEGCYPPANADTTAQFYVIPTSDGLAAASVQVNFVSDDGKDCIVEAKPDDIPGLERNGVKCTA